MGKDQKRSFYLSFSGEKMYKAHEGEVIIVTVVDAAGESVSSKKLLWLNNRQPHSV